jgi:hypothetical protein
MTTSRTATALRVSGSVGLTWKRSERSRRVSANAAASPTATPTAVSRTDWPRTIATTRPTSAPRAIRTPISLVRSPTTYAMTP